MKIGDVVRHKQSGRYGTVEYSTFGASVHALDEKGRLLKGLGHPISDLEKSWEVVEMPEGYERGCQGGIKKIAGGMIVHGK